MDDERAIAFPVPLQTDSVAPYRLVSGGLGVVGGSEASSAVDSALFFEIAESKALGRVTFEGLDSIRASRGEVLPYEFGSDFSSWVYIVQDSRWLAERHAYEWTHYETPMLTSYQHYVFVFHDDFVEALAAGIWIDEPPSDPLQPGPDHPLAGLADSLTYEVGSTAGLQWELARTNRREANLLQDAQLCSQPLFSFALVLDGTRSAPATAWLRVRDGVATSVLAHAWSTNLASLRGVAAPRDFLSEWELYCGQVADRRRAMRK